MDLASALSIVQSLQAQQTDMSRLSFTIAKVKEVNDLQESTVARLLASLPSLSPDGVGGNIDCCA